MLLYVNGCSHSVGHAIINTKCGMCEDDQRFSNLGEAPHPENYPFSYGYLLAKKHNLSLLNQGKSGGSIDRVIRTTKQFLAQYVGDVCILIGWPGFDREEWKFQNAYYQINASGTDIVPDGLKQRYKEWVIKMGENRDSHEYWVKPTLTSFNKIKEFHFYLKNKNVKHLFFNTAGDFDQVTQGIRVDFGNNYITPYTANSAYLDQMFLNQFQMRDDWYHYGADAHQFWADYLDPYLVKVLDET